MRYDVQHLMEKSMTRPKFDAFLTVRVSERTRTQFNIKSERYGKPTDVLRELVHAFIDDRISIEAPSTVKESLYVTRK